MLTEYFSYIRKTKDQLRQLKTSSTKFWKISKRLLHKPEADAAIPALRRKDGTWARSPSEKAEELATTFRKKWNLPSFEEINDYSVPSHDIESATGSLILRTRHALKTLKQLKEKSATGTDDLGTIILRRCANELGLPFCKICRLIIRIGIWPRT